MSRAVQVESLLAGRTDLSGEPLAAGKVYSYAAGTSTPKALYTIPDKTVSAANPVILDAAGRALVYGDGGYKFIIKTAADVTLYTEDNLIFQDIATTFSYWGVTSTGSSSNYAIAPSPGIIGYENGQRFTFIANHTNTGGATLSVNGLSAVTFRRGPTGDPFAAGEIRSGSIVDVIYDSSSGGRFLPAVLKDAASTWTPALDVVGGMTNSSLVVSQAEYQRVGTFLFFRTFLTFTAGGVADALIQIATPQTGIDDPNTCWYPCGLINGGTRQAGFWHYKGNRIVVILASGGNFTLGNIEVSVQGSYRLS